MCTGRETTNAMHAKALPITGPCPIDLDAIGFDRQSRVSHCSHCVKNVHNLSNMTRAEATQWMRANRGKKLCVSYAKDADGRVKFAEPKPEPAPLVPLARLRRGPSRRAGLAAAVTMTAALAACTPHGEGPPKADTVTAVASGLNATERRVDETKKHVVPQPEPMPLAGAAVIPEPMVEGEMEIPDEPCDKDGDNGSTALDDAKPGTDVSPVPPADTVRARGQMHVMPPSGSR